MCPGLVEAPLQEAFFVGGVERGDARGNPQLVIDGGDVVVDGVGTNHEALGDLMVTPAFGQQAQHLQFAGC